jgi:thioredoxin-related protein
MNNVLRSRLSFKGAWLAGLLIIGLIAVNLLIVKQNFAMRRQLTERANAVNPNAKSLKEGDVVTSLVGSDLKGRKYEVSYGKDERKHLLFYFSPGCAYCVQQAHLWRDVLNKVDSNHVEVMGLVSDKEDQQAVLTHAEELGYLKTRTPLPVLFVSRESLARYKLIATPTTLLVSSDGNVEHVWVGKWDETKTNEVAAALK